MFASFSAHKLREAPSVQIQLSCACSQFTWLFEWEVVGSLLPELPSGSISKVLVFPPPSSCWLPPPAPSVFPSHRSVAPYLQAHSPSLCFDVRALIVNTASVQPAWRQALPAEVLTGPYRVMMGGRIFSCAQHEPRWTLSSLTAAAQYSSQSHCPTHPFPWTSTASAISRVFS